MTRKWVTLKAKKKTKKKIHIHAFNQPAKKWCKAARAGHINRHISTCSKAIVCFHGDLYFFLWACAASNVKVCSEKARMNSADRRDPQSWNNEREDGMCGSEEKLQIHQTLLSPFWVWTKGNKWSWRKQVCQTYPRMLELKDRIIASHLQHYVSVTGSSN